MRFRLVVALSALALASGCGEDTVRDINFGKDVGWDYTLPDGTVPTDGGDAREGGTEGGATEGGAEVAGDGAGGTTDAVTDTTGTDTAAPTDATGGGSDVTADAAVDMAPAPDAGADATDDLASAG